MTIVCLTAHIYKIQYSATFVLQSEFQNAWRSIIYFEIYLSECKSFLQSQIFNIFFVFWILNNENDQKSNFRYQKWLDLRYYLLGPFLMAKSCIKNHFLRKMIVGFVPSFFTLGYLGQIREDGLVSIWAEFQLSILFRSN